MGVFIDFPVTGYSYVTDCHVIHSWLTTLCTQPFTSGTWFEPSVNMLPFYLIAGLVAILCFGAPLCSEHMEYSGCQVTNGVAGNRREGESVL